MSPSEALSTPAVDWLAMGPPLALFAAAIAIVLLRSLVRHADWVFPAAVGVALAGIAGAAVAIGVWWNVVADDGPYQALAGMVAVDRFAAFVGAVVLLATLLGLLVSVGYLRREGLEGPEYLALLLLSATGMLLMASANDLVIVFLALEVLSIALYVLTAFDARRLESQEAGFKYFLLGSFSSAVFLYGVALAYGATGTTSLTGIAGFLAGTTLLESGTMMAAIALLLVGLGFKVAAVPFHMWTPDVYQGAPTPVTTFMAGATKAAAFGALLRVLVGAFATYRVDWRPIVWALAALSLLLGSVVALVQSDVKRALAYSSIVHAGYILVGVEAATDRGTSAALFYLLVYALMTIGAFAVVGLVAGPGDSRHGLDEYRGLARREPLLAGLLTFFLLASAGVPFTGGFVAKLAVFEAAVDAGQQWLALLGMVVAAIAAFLYLRIVVAMFSEAPPDAPRLRVDGATRVVLVACGVLVLVLGITPDWALDLARDATQLLAAR